MKKLWGLALLGALLLGLTACGDIGLISGEDGPVAVYMDDAAGGEDGVPGEAEDLPEEPEDPPVSDASDDGEDLPYEDGLPGIDEDGTYNSAEDGSLYLYTFGHLPNNYITKNEARDLGWTGGSVERYAPGCAIGGDKFGNREGVLPEGTYHECDIDTIGESSRGAKRLVYADDGRIYYTGDHYETFELLYGEE